VKILNDLINVEEDQDGQPAVTLKRIFTFFQTWQLNFI